MSQSPPPPNTRTHPHTRAHTLHTHAHTRTHTHTHTHSHTPLRPHTHSHTHTQSHTRTHGHGHGHAGAAVRRPAGGEPAPRDLVRGLRQLCRGLRAHHALRVQLASLPAADDSGVCCVRPRSLHARAASTVATGARSRRSLHIRAVSAVATGVRMCLRAGSRPAPPPLSTHAGGLPIHGGGAMQAC